MAGTEDRRAPERPFLTTMDIMMVLFQQMGLDMINTCYWENILQDESNFNPKSLQH